MAEVPVNYFISLVLIYENCSEWLNFYSNFLPCIIHIKLVNYILKELIFD